MNKENYLKPYNLFAIFIVLIIVSCTPQEVTLEVENGTGSGVYRKRKKVDISANESQHGYRFYRWEGDRVIDKYLPTTKIALFKDINKVTATYIPEDELHQLTVTGGTKTGKYHPGEAITIEPIESGNMKFYKWEGNIELLDSPYYPTQKIHMPRMSIKLNATFKKAYNLEVIDGKGSGKYIPGKNVIIEPYYIQNMKFYKWEGNTELLNSEYYPTQRIKMPEIDISFKAIFREYRSLKIIDGKGSGKYIEGQKISIQASTPLNDSVFKRWIGNTEYVTNIQKNKTTVTMPDKNISLTATFDNVIPCSDYGTIKKFKQQGISEGYCLPRNKQGIGDGDFGNSSNGIGKYPVNQRQEIFKKRYNVYQNKINAGIKAYNLWWIFLEHSSHQARQNLQDVSNCPNNYIMIPANEHEKNKYGFNKYRCINQTMLNVFDNLLKLDALHEMQTAVVLYSAPHKYIYNECEGLKHLGKMACLPREDAMDDYEDYVRILSTRYNGKCDLQSCIQLNPGKAKIYHYITWNEVDHSIWLREKGGLSYNIQDGLNSPMIQHLMKRYIHMMELTDKAISSGTKGVMQYIPLTTELEGPGPSFNGIHIGGYNFLKKVWEQVGTKFPWSVSYHPYGIKGNPNHGMKHIDKILQLQSENLANALQINISNIDLKEYPQMYIFLSEQGMARNPNNNDEDLIAQAEYLCLAHKRQFQFADFMVGTVHNYFYSTEDELSANGCQTQGACYAFIPNHLVDIDLANLSDVPTGEAYISTSLNNWRKNDDHYCCREQQLGCKTPSLNRDEFKLLGRLENIKNNNYIGWALDLDDTSSEISIRVTDSKGKKKLFTTSTFRNDINSKYFVPGKHGFTIPLEEVEDLANGYLSFYAIDRGNKIKYLGRHFKEE